MKSRPLQHILLFSLLSAITVSAFFGCGSKEPQEITVTPSETAQPSAASTASPAPQTDDNASNEPDKIIQAREKNPDAIGWLTIPNTKIDYPVVLTDNNDYYIDHDIDKKESKSGAIFMDFRNNDENQQRHIIIYGHNMKNGTMFHDLNAFKIREFIKNNNTLTLWVWGEERTYEIYSQFVLTTDVNFIKTTFDSDKAYLKFITELQQQAKYPSDVQLTAEDEILTLSTCTYEYTDSRCVIQARRVS